MKNTKENVDMTTFDNIKKYAQQRGMNLQEVAKQSGLSANMIYQYKKVNPKLDTLNKIANTLHVSTNDLLGKEEKKKEHIDVSKILEADQLYLKNTALSEEDRKQVQAVLSALLNSKEGQQRLRERGYKG